ncbi:odorant receptor 107 [Nasonia vitripennis]|uniref:Odorant receptor n=1 Tax=Nasonia vitripennis TaxID=7425 RepID=A0A7M6UDY9_NASVI|nr:odorant receptor 107 [Nasonia vitripennis]
MEVMDTIKSTDIMPLPFFYLKLSGAWKPSSWPSYLRLIYDSYTILMTFFIMKVIIVTEILYVIFAEENQSKVLKDNVYIICTFINGWFKMFNLICRRKNIANLVKGCIAKQWNPPRDNYESSVLAATKQTSRKITLAHASVVGSCVVSTLLNSVLSSPPFLPVDAWYPCNITLPICFWTSFVHQSIGYTVTAIVHVANDNIVVGFMMQICAQLNVLNRRLLLVHVEVEKAARQQKDQSQITSLETTLVNDCIVNYRDILKFAEQLSETFIETIFIQFCAGLSVICTSVYVLTTLNIFSFEFFGMFLYLWCMLGQMFLYCWFGNEVVLNSSKLFHSIYNMDWIKLQSQTQTKLLFMMLVASSPIQLFRGAIIRVNLDAFINILKFSYSAFNILH